MPELPEVETMRRGLLGVEGSRILAAERTHCRLKPILIKPRIDAFQRRVVDQRIVQLGRLGKRVVVHLEKGDAILFEPRMTGLVLVADPPNGEHLRFRLLLGGGPVAQIWYWDRRGLGSVQLFSADEYSALTHSRQFGPDALDISMHELRARIGASRREVKVALLDQRALAGVGNLYASEILHAAGINPRRPCRRVTAAEWCRIHAAMIAVLTDAIHYEGSTLGDGTYRNALNHPGKYQNHHRVYDRADQLCTTCQSAVIKRIVQNQRSTFYCPECQSGRKSTGC